MSDITLKDVQLLTKRLTDVVGVAQRAETARAIHEAEVKQLLDELEGLGFPRSVPKAEKQVNELYTKVMAELEALEEPE